jgi:hypothetical protein
MSDYADTTWCDTGATYENTDNQRLLGSILNISSSLIVHEHIHSPCAYAIKKRNKGPNKRML